MVEVGVKVRVVGLRVDDGVVVREGGAVERGEGLDGGAMPSMAVVASSRSLMTCHGLYGNTSPRHINFPGRYSLRPTARKEYDT